MQSIIEVYERLLLARRGHERLILRVDMLKMTMFLGSNDPGLVVLMRDYDRMHYVNDWLSRRTTGKVFKVMAKVT